MIQTYTLRKPVKAIRYNGKNFKKIEAMCPADTDFYWNGTTGVFSVDGERVDSGDWVVVDPISRSVSVCESPLFRKLFKMVAK